MSKIIIHNKSKINDFAAFDHIKSIIRMGLMSVSKFGKTYISMADFDDCVIYSDITQERSHVFTIKNRK